MCLITLNWQPGQPVSLLVAANRDEFYARPALGVHHWPDQRILAGQDMQAGGTWLGLGTVDTAGVAGVEEGSTHIRMAALTNYRDVASHNPNAASRGDLTVAFLNSTISARQYLEQLTANTRLYNPFNLIVFDGRTLMGFESRNRRMFVLPTGITSVSNADFNTPWPKLESLRCAFEETLAANQNEAWTQDRLFRALSDNRVAPDDALPQTGIPVNKERVLSAAFIRTPDYGTRASSVIRIKPQVAEFTERCFDAHGLTAETTQTLSWGKACLQP